MKPKYHKLRSFLALSGSALLTTSQAHAINYYWDNNGDTAGFGTAAGTWSNNASLFSESSTGVVTPTGFVVTALTDSANFGTATVGNGLGTGTITVDGTVNILHMTFGSQTGAITINSINNGTIASGNAGINVNGGAGAILTINANYSGATTAWSGVGATTIHNGNFANTGQSTVSSGHNLQFGSTATLTLPSRGINFANSSSATGTIRYSSNNDGSFGGSVNGIGTATIFIKDGSATSTLTLNAANGHAGKYQIDVGTLKFARRDGIYGGTTASWLAPKITVGNTGVLGLNVGGTNQFTTTDVTTLLTNLGGANGTSTTGFAAGSAIGFDTTNAAGSTFTVADVIADSTGTGGGSLGVDKIGTNALVLTNTNTYTGATRVKGGTLRIGGSGTLGNGNYAANVSIVSGATFNVDSTANQTLGGVISGAGVLTKSNSGTLTLEGDNDYTGTTNLNGGSLIINGSTSSTSIVTVAAGATLGGTGSVGGNTTIQANGTLSPGNSPGTLTFENNLTLNSGAIYALEAGDLTAVSGTLTLTDNWVLALGAGFQDGGSTLIFTYGTLTGGADLTPTFNIAGLGFTPTGTLSLTDDGEGSIFLNGVSAIPEPSTALLGALGALALLRRRRN